MGRGSWGLRGAQKRALIAAAAVVAAAAALLAATAGPAAAHPFTDETIPARFSSAPVGTSEVIVRYSESVEIGHSSLEVFDGEGSRVDNGDTAYYGDGDTALVVTTPPLGEGTYTVASKVLSRVDGHLVPSAFVFGVGDVVLEDPGGAGQELGIGELIFFEQAGARFPGLAGQTVVLGAVISSLLVWAGVARRHAGGGNGGSGEEEEGLAAAVHSRTMTLVGIGLVAVLASNMIMLAVQMVALDAPAGDVLQTSFGTTWIVRMGITAALIGAWFAAERRRSASALGMLPLLALSLALIATTTMMGHGTASGEPAAVALDYLHNLVAAAWIGGVAYLAFALLPALRGRGGAAGGRDTGTLMLAAIPRFTVVAAVSIGIVVVSGPLLMWILDGDIGEVAGSTYGRLIMAKVALALAMVGMAAHHHRVAAAAAAALRKGKRFDLLGRIGPGLRAEAIVGMALIGAVALLSNSTLPDGEFQSGAAAEGAEGAAPAYAGLSAVEYTDAAAFGVEVRPFAPGPNTVRVAVAGHDGSPLGDVEGVKVKVSNPLRGISPIEAPVRAESASDPGGSGAEGESGGIETYAADVSFGFPGRWQLEIEALRSGSASESLAMDLLVKPRLADVDARVTEYDFPDAAAAPLFPQYDPATGMIWITDASAPVIWAFSPEDESFAAHPFGGQAGIALDVDPSDGRVWFTDVREGNIGYIDPASNESGAVEFPKIVPVLERSMAVSIDADGDGGVWAAIINKGVIARYDRGTGEFDLYGLPSEEPAPFGIAADPGRAVVWFAQQGPGTIGRLDTETGEIDEIAPERGRLMTPETLTVAPDGSLWISEHQEGGAVTRYDPLLGGFERVPAPDPAAFPNSAALDRYGNVWFAMHTVDKLGVHDPLSGETASVPVPSAGSWVQFMTADGDGNVWFVEQGTAKLGRLSVGYAPTAAAGGAGGEESTLAAGEEPGPTYSEVAGPLMAAGIVAASLMAVRGVRDRREADEIVETCG